MFRLERLEKFGLHWKFLFSLKFNLAQTKLSVIEPLFTEIMMNSGINLLLFINPYLPNILLKYSSLDFVSQLSTINYKIKLLCQYKKQIISRQQLTLTQTWSLEKRSIKKNEQLKKHDVFRIDKFQCFLIRRFLVCEKKTKFSVSMENITYWDWNGEPGTSAADRLSLFDSYQGLKNI